MNAKIVFAVAKTSPFSFVISYSNSIEAVGEATIAAGWGEWGADVMMDYSKAYAEGWGDFTTNDVETVTGKKARTFSQFSTEILATAIN